MKYNELDVIANKNKKRVGRGIAAGGGKTAGRGTKGQGARTGKKLGAMFQGGNGPIARRIPKNKGFKSLRTPAQVVYLDRLNDFDGKTVDNLMLFEAGLIATPFHSVKVILRGEMTAKVILHTQFASSSVKAQLEKKGGEFVKTSTPLQQAKQAAEASDKK